MASFVRGVKSAQRRLRERRERQSARVAIVSFPKCGRTWLRLLIGKALCDRHGLPDGSMLDTLELSRLAGLLPTVFSHDGTSNTVRCHLARLDAGKWEYRDKRVLFLRRDPRDVVVSCWYQAVKRRRLFDGTLSEFLRDPRHGIEKVLTFYGHWYAARQVPERFELVSYERLHADPGKVLRVALELMGALDVDDGIVRDAVAYGRFDNMRRLEESGRFESRRLQPGIPDDRDTYKVRRGRVGGWADELCEADQAFCRAAIERLGCPFLEL